MVQDRERHVDQFDFDVCCDVTNVCRSPFAADYIVYLWIKQKGCFSLCLFNGKHWLACAADGSLVDLFHGQADIQARIFRHVSPAFREDPVRILRLARFAARFPDFTIAPETLALMREMTAAGKVHALVAG